MAKRSLEEELDYEEFFNLEDPGCSAEQEGEDVRVVKKKKRVRTIKCISCGEACTHLGRHATRHLPWFWSANTACWACHSQNGNLQVLEQHIRDEHEGNLYRCKFNLESRMEQWVQLVNGCQSLLQLDFPQGLVDLINNTMDPHHFRQLQLNTTEMELCKEHSSYNALPVTDFSIFNTSSTFGTLSLLHWRILLTLITKLPVVHQENIIKSTERRDQLGLVVNNQTEEVLMLSITDAQFHLDKFMSSAGYPGLHGLDKMGTESFKTDIDCAVANYCFPDRYPSSNGRSELRKESQIVFAYGIHPRTVHSTTPQNLHNDFERLTQIIKSTRTVAVGECVRYYE